MRVTDDGGLFLRDDLSGVNSAIKFNTSKDRKLLLVKTWDSNDKQTLNFLDAKDVQQLKDFLNANF